MAELNNTILLIDPAGVTPTTLHYFELFNTTFKVIPTLPASFDTKNILAIIIHSKLIATTSFFQRTFSDMSLPILVIDDTFNEANCIGFLESGADDYLVKPVNPRELYTRINVIARRIKQNLHEPDKEVYYFAGWCLYPRSRRLLKDCKQEVPLSSGEYTLLLEFLQHPQEILTRDHLLHITKNKELYPFDRRIDVQISRLRHKIEENAKTPLLIKTIRNSGYILTANVKHQYE